MRKMLLALSLLAFSFTAAQSQDLSGQNDPQFSKSLQAWLDADDGAALPELSALAKSGNEAARLLLGSIDQYSYLHSDYTRNLDRKQRTALLREEKGLSGRSWLKSLDAPVAQGLLESRHINQRKSGLPKLFNAGHYRQIYESLDAIVNDQELNLAFSLAVDPKLKPVAGPLAILLLYRAEAGGMPKSNVAALRTVLEEPPGISDASIAAWFKHERAYVPFVKSTQGLEAAVTELPGMAVAKQLCETECPNDIAGCVVDINATVPEHLGVVTMSPVESLISTDAYRASKRIDQDFRRFLATRNLVRPDLRLSQCNIQHLFQNAP